MVSHDVHPMHLFCLLTTIEPSTGQQLSSVVSVNQADFQLAIDSAARAQETFYENTTGSQRGSLLRAWFDRIQCNVEDRQ